MTDDEFDRIKDAEKQRLRARRTLRRLQQALREQKEAGRGTVARMTERIQALFNDHRSALDALQWDTARLEARLDALRDTLTGGSADTDPDPGVRGDGPRGSDVSGDSDASDDEATLRMYRAERLVDDLRTQLDTDAPTDAPGESSSSTSTDDSPESAPPDDGLPDKTIGRVPRS